MSKEDRRFKLEASLKPIKRDILIQDTSNKVFNPVSITKQKHNQIKKTEIFTDRVTLALTPEQKDFIDSLSENFQRKRTIKGEAINRNTLIRCLIEVLKSVKFEKSEIVNSETELKELLKKKLGL